MNDLTGLKSGRLSVKRPTTMRDRKGYVIWECNCECGKVCYVSSHQLKSNNTKSCGCLQKETITQRNKANAKYPLTETKSRLYRIWKGMLARTIYPSQEAYKNYGGRGITVCDEWANDFYKFKDWALNNGYNDTLSIDRIDVNGNYCPDNCKWATRKEQSNNQRSNIVLEYNGEKHTAAQWADIMGISHSTVYKRIYRHRPIDIVLKEYVNK